MLEKNTMRFLGLLALGFGLAFSGKVPSSVNSGKGIEFNLYPSLKKTTFALALSLPEGKNICIHNLYPFQIHIYGGK